LKKSVLVILAAALVVGLVGCKPDQRTAAPVAESAYDNYVGSAVCGGCHSATYNKFINSGHPYKLTKVVNGKKPLDFPFTVLPDIPNNLGLKDGDNTLGPPAGYGDVSYVIGGYKWKARFVDTNGYIVTGSDVQYNFETNAFVGYHDNETDKPYNCGKCHTTGWIPFEDGGMRKDGLPGMAGNFFEGGVHCEECHGPGAAHVNNHGDPDYIELDRSSELCGRCHTRDSQNRIAVSGGLIRHHEQYDELLGLHPDDPGAGGWGKHLRAGIGCNTCHDVHASTVHSDLTGSPGVVIDCEDCHQDRILPNDNPHSQQALASQGLLSEPNGKILPNCVSCHMPRMSKSAVGIDPVGTGPKVGDIKSHIFKIDLSQREQFTPDGKFALPWLTAQFACKQCHNGVYFFDIPVPVGYQVHTRR
jgi:hypothetical protein